MRDRSKNDREDIENCVNSASSERDVSGVAGSGDLIMSSSSLKSRSSARKALKPLTEEGEEAEDESRTRLVSPSMQSIRSHLSRASITSTTSLRDSLSHVKSGGDRQVKSAGRAPSQPPDEEHDTDLEEEEPEKIPFREMCTLIYKESCQQMGVVPASFFIRYMHEDELVMKHHGLGPLGTKAIAISLCTNTSIVRLDLEDNSMGPSGAEALAEMLKDNCYVAELDISHNEIGSYGCLALSEMLCQNRNIKSLRLAGNGLRDRDAEAVARFILENNQIKELDLSHNEFCEIGGAVLGPAIGENEIIELLDLSWNHLRRGGSIAVCDGIKNNALLKCVSLAFNGLGNEGAVAVADVLKNNHVLLELDVSNNRISTEGGMVIAKGLFANETIKVFRIGNNPIDPAGTNAILQAINHERNVMDCLDLSNIAVDREFLDLKKDILQARPELTILHGLVMGESDRRSRTCTGISPELEAMRDLCNLLDTSEEEFLKSDPMALIRSYVDKHNLRLLDLFNSIDKDRNFKISKEEFVDGIKSVGINLNRDQVKVLTKKLNIPEDGMIDFREIAVGDRRTKHQRRVLAKIDQEVRRLSLEGKAGRRFPSVKEVLKLKRLTDRVKNHVDFESYG